MTQSLSKQHAEQSDEPLIASVRLWDSALQDRTSYCLKTTKILLW
jgi:hypothetical protein